MATAKLMEIAASNDPRRAIQSAIGDVSKISLFSGRVLLATYIAPEKTAGGIYRPQANVKEDIWQGVVGLVIKKGATAFKDDGSTQFHGQDVSVGDWVTFRPGDAKRIQINGVECRIVEDVLIDMVIENPDVVTHSR
jgi:co-chaperonin GroES (HSP10)